MDRSISDIDRLYIEGNRHLHRGNFAVAVDIFERLLKVIEPDRSLYFNVRRNLVKAYQKNDQTEQAIALCQSMIDSDDNIAVLWGTKFMANLVPESNSTVPISESTDRKTAKTASQAIVSSTKPKTLLEFKQYCQEHLLKNLKAIEQKRIETLASMFLGGAILLIFNWGLIHFIFYVYQIERGNTLSLYFCGLVILIPIWIIFCRGCIQVYRIGFKRNIIEKIVSFLDRAGTLKYASNLLLEDKRQTIQGFTRSQIFRDELHEPDSLEQEDCVYGTIGKTDIFFAEITAVDLKKACLNRWERPEEHGKSVIFHGLFFEARFPKSFVGRTFILPNTLKSKITSLNSWRGEEIKLEDPEFERRFRIYSDNQIEARYLLSTNLMSRLVNFSYKAKRKVYLSFVGGFVYIAIPYRYNLFEAKLFQNMTFFAPLKEYFLDLQLMIGIVDDLNLNIHIWKQ